MSTSPLTLDHVAIPVRDLKASLTFYGEVLGLSLVGAVSGSDWGGRDWLIVSYGLGDGRSIALTSFKPNLTQTDPADLPTDARHYALRTGDLVSWRKRLEGAGIAVREEDHGDQLSLFISDPNGVIWEITSPARPSAPSDLHSALAVVEAWMKP